MSGSEEIGVGLQVGAEKELRTVIEGESLFNDGSAYVLFLLFHVSTVQYMVLCVAWQYGMQALLCMLQSGRFCQV